MKWDDHELDRMLRDLEPEEPVAEGLRRQVWGRIAVAEREARERGPVPSGGWSRAPWLRPGIAAMGLLTASLAGGVAGWWNRPQEADARQQYLESLSPFHHVHEP